MSDIPPIHAAAAQAGFRSREAGAAADARRNEQSQAASQQVKTVSDAAATVDTTDADNQVFVDSEGAGSQGRSFDEQPGEDAADRGGITRDDKGRIHLDLDA